MAFADIAGKIKYPAKTSARYKRLDALDRLRQGTLYDHIKKSFDGEYEGPEYVPLRDRRPSIIWNGASMLVDQLAGLLWGDEQMPIVRTYEGESPSEADRKAEAGIQHIAEILNLDDVMDNATELASSGSAAIFLRATPSKSAYIEVVPGKECTPKFDPRDPQKLESIDQCYPTTAGALVEMGYELPDDVNEDDAYWFRLTIDAKSETRYVPMRSDRYEMLGSVVDGVKVEWQVDPDNTWTHGWGLLPAVWVKAPSRGSSKIDGDCLYGKIVDMLVAIDYDLSQIERGFRYSADPMIAIRQGELSQNTRPIGRGEEANVKDRKGNVVKSPAQVLRLDAGSEAKLLEISGQGLDKSREFIATLREWGLEIAGGMKSDASTTKGVESGRALEMLYQSLILVVKRWRVALGNMVYLPLIRILLAGIADGTIEVEGVDDVEVNTTMRLVWPTWMTPSGADLLSSAQAWQTLAGGSAKAPVPILPRATVTRLAGGNLGMTDTSTLVDEVSRQNDDDDAKAQAAAAVATAAQLAQQTSGDVKPTRKRAPKKPAPT